MEKIIRNILSVQGCPKSIKTTINRQYCRKFLPVQCCPKSIKTTLERLFYNVMLSGASRATLNKVFTCEMMSQEY